MVLLGGESGVGKTRLVAELERRLSTSVLVLRGESVEQSDHGDGELPVRAAAGRAPASDPRAQHEVFDQLGAGEPIAARGADPGPRRRVRRDRRCATTRPASCGCSRRCSICSTCCRASRTASCSCSRTCTGRIARRGLFTTFLARSLRQERLMLLLTFRSDELHRRHPLRPLLAELERLERARRIELAPFDRVELTEALTDILGEPPTRRARRAAVRPQRGQRAVHRGAARGRTRRPRRRSPEPSRRVPAADRAAARRTRNGSRGWSPSAGGSTTTRSPSSPVSTATRLNDALRDAVAEQVLMTGDDDRFLFRHALLREALYDDLLPGERSELHLALARAFEHERAPDEEQEVRCSRRRSPTTTRRPATSRRR